MLTLLFKVAKLSKMVMHQDTWQGGTILPIGDVDGTSGFVSLNELIIEVDTSLLSLADLLVLIQDVKLLPIHGGPGHHVERALLDDGSGTLSIASELNYEETHSVLELGEVELLCPLVVG